MRKIIQIKGANATGKTTIARQLISLSSNIELVNNPRVTLLHDLNIVLMGHYSGNYVTGGGCENTTLRPIENLKSELELASLTYCNYDVIFESMMLSTTMTAYNFMISNLFSRQPIVVLLISSLQGCLDRLKIRSQELRKESHMVSTEPIQQKVALITRHLKYYNSNHVRYIQVDNIPKEDMVFEFLSVIGWSYPT